MNHKRKKPRTKVRCQLCSDNRYGNSQKSARKADKQNRETAREQLREVSA